MVARDARLEIISRIGAIRESTVLSYVTGDRAGAEAQIGDDAVRHFVQHLRELSPIQKLDLFIYSRGGATDVPWRLVSAIRNASESWSVIIPYRANSAATMIALGADEIVMGPQAELGPIDPSLTLRRHVPGDGEPTIADDNVSVEDVLAYVQFVQERVGLSDQAALAAGLGKLTDRLDAVALGSVHRTHSHIRDVARRIVLSRSEPPTAQVVDNIVSTLAERVYAHGHAISRREAAELGLPVTEPSAELDAMVWQLLEAYEEHMKLLEPLEPIGALTGAGSDQVAVECTQAIIESGAAIHEFKSIKQIRAQRALPQTLNVAVNVNLQQPQDVVPGAAQGLQALLGQAQAAIQQEAFKAVRQALEYQAPVVGVQVRNRIIGWRRTA